MIDLEDLPNLPLETRVILVSNLLQHLVQLHESAPGIPLSPTHSRSSSSERSPPPSSRTNVPRGSLLISSQSTLPSVAALQSSNALLQASLSSTSGELAHL